MIITAWILLIFFSMFSLSYLMKFFKTSVEGVNIIVWFFSIFMVALSAGVIWGDLFVK